MINNAAPCCSAAQACEAEPSCGALCICQGPLLADMRNYTITWRISTASGQISNREKNGVLGGGMHRGLLSFLLRCFSLLLSARVGFTALYHRGAFCRRPTDSRRCCLTLFYIRQRAGRLAPPLSFLSSTFQGRTCGRGGLLPAWPGSLPAVREKAWERRREGGRSEGVWTTTDEQVRRSRSVETTANNVYPPPQL